MATQQQHVSQRERERRAQQSQSARGNTSETTSTEPSLLAETATEAGLREAVATVEQLSPERLQEIQDEFAVVNLDELYAEPFTVAYRAYVDEEIEDEDGKKRVRRRPVKRTALLDPLVPADLQLKAMALNSDKSRSQEAKLRQMIALVVDVWNRTEPGMTTERLLEIMDIQRISAIFQRLFNQATSH